VPPELYYMSFHYLDAGWCTKTYRTFNDGLNRGEGLQVSIQSAILSHKSLLLIKYLIQDAPNPNSSYVI
jgi:hypothetical protein